MTHSILEKLKGNNTLISDGVSHSPAWVNVRNRIKFEGETDPGIEVMKEWIKALI